MKKPGDLAVDPASPDAHVEDHFFQQGIDHETGRHEVFPVVEYETRRSRQLRLVATGAIVTVGVVAVGLLIWGGPPEESAATVAVIAPAAAASPPPAPPPAPVAAPAPAPVAVAPPPAPVAVASPPAEDTAQLEQTCREAFDRKQYKVVLESCSRAFEARPDAAPLAALVAEAELDRGHAASALGWARKAVAVDPTLADPYAFIGSAEQQAGHAAAAKTAYLKYLELAPTGRFAPDLKAIVGR